MSHGHAHSEGPSAESLALNHEQSDTRARPLIYSAVALAAMLVLAFVVAGVLIFFLAGPGGETSNTLSDSEVSQLQLPPAPRLEQNPRADGDRIVGAANERLASYGWANQRAGRAYVPIERAMELLVEQGVVFPAAP